MRKKIVAGNWKMNTTVNEAIVLVRAMLPDLDKVQGMEKLLCPPFISLAAIKELLKGTSVKLGAQNMYFKDKGAYTGEISPIMLAGMCDFVILGHSERRQLMGEIDEVVNKKVKTAFEFGLTPILCVGETLAENEAGGTEKVITTQVKAALAGIAPTDKLVVAYEPIWAIGTGQNATPEQAEEVHDYIRQLIAGRYGKSLSACAIILYGGSVKP
ncbi:MAG TPA: triose-phosphate isomerase, partial [Bacteroidales bacterium]|nr:triose-phosphate isomerase [Bacteroidales bacterium]